MRYNSIIYILLTAVAFEVSCDCGTVLVARGGFNGFPWTVMIVDHAPDYPIKCIGSLISTSVVVTAASCFYNETSSSKIDSNTRVVVASDYMLSTQSSEIKTIHLARGYQGRRTFYDKNIAWLILKNPFNITRDVRPVCIDFGNEYESEDLQSGQVNRIRARFEPLPHARGSAIISRTRCISNLPEEAESFVTADHFCIRSPFESNELRKERAGAGFFSEHDGRWYIRGILSHEYREIHGDKPIGTVMNIGGFIDEMKGYIGKKNYECGIVTLPVNPLIVSGYRAEPGGFPWHVAVYQRNLTGFYDQICGGSLISLNVVMSACYIPSCNSTTTQVVVLQFHIAAHCFYDDSIKQLIDADNYAVAAGKHKRPYNWLERFVQKSPVDTIHISTRYYGIDGLYAGDIAWLILKNPFYLSTYVTPICLESNSQDVSARLQDGQVGKVAGWGFTADDISSHELQEMSASVVPYNVCISTLPRDARPYVTIDKFCAGYVNGTMPCNGDSGGGLVFQRNGHWYLRGIVSVNPVVSMTCNTTGYTAFTDVLRYTDELYRFTNITTHDLI